MILRHTFVEMGRIVKSVMHNGHAGKLRSRGRVKGSAHVHRHGDGTDRCERRQPFLLPGITHLWDFFLQGFWYRHLLTMPIALRSSAGRRAAALRWLVLPVGFALLTPALWAQVVFQKEVAGPSNRAPILQASNAPFDLSDALYDSSTTHEPTVMTASGVYYRIDPTTANVSNPALIPLPVKLTVDSFVSFAGRNTSSPIAFFLGYRQTLWVVSFAGPTPVILGPLEGVSVPVGRVSSMAAADHTHLTMIADQSFVSINITTGAVTPVFAFDGGTGPGQFSDETHQHAYGPNGMLYVLDYGNDRMQILDPGNDFAYVSEFSLESGVPTVNIGFAIGVNGNIYLGDGAGGGSTYSADGDFLGTFAPSGPPTPLPGSKGRAFLDTDAAGNVYVYDSIGDFGISQFQYRDTSVVPEASTSALIAGAGAAFLALFRRRPRVL